MVALTPLAMQIRSAIHDKGLIPGAIADIDPGGIHVYSKDRRPSVLGFKIGRHRPVATIWFDSQQHQTTPTSWVMYVKKPGYQMQLFDLCDLLNQRFGAVIAIR